MPLNALQLRRVAKRASLGIGRGVAMVNAPHLNDDELDVIYEATVHATEESVINAMLAAESTPFFRGGSDGAQINAIDHTTLVRMVNRGLPF